MPFQRSHPSGSGLFSTDDQRSLSAPVTRRQVVAGAVGAAGLLTTASLSGRRGAAQQSTPAAGTRSVATIHGPVEVPANPQRVVAITYISSIAAAELGVIPVGVTRWVPALPPGFADLSPIAKIENEAYELDLEAIIALKPDLILGSDVATAADQSLPYDQLSRIAPTALFEWIRGGANWEVEAAGCAEALGKNAAFDALRATYTKSAADIKNTYADLLDTLTVDFLDAGQSEWFLHGPASTHCKVAIDAGVKLGAGATQSETFTAYSFEQLNVLGDTGALVVRNDDPSLDILNALPTFTGLPAVEAKRLVPSDYFYVASYAQCNALLGELNGGLETLSAL